MGGGVDVLLGWEFGALACPGNYFCGAIFGHVQLPLNFHLNCYAYTYIVMISLIVCFPYS